MNEKDTLALLIYCNELDARHSPNEMKVRAWHDVFRESCSGMTLAFASDVARKHYSLVDAMLTPNVFVKAWNDHVHARAIGSLQMDVEQMDRHCKRSSCQCAHTDPCYRGWLDNDKGTAVPCPNCRSSLARVLGQIPPLGMRNDHDMAKIRNRYVEA